MATNEVAPPLTHDQLHPGDWIKMTAPGFVIYGKVTGGDPHEGQVNIITSSLVNNMAPLKKATAEMSLERISEKDVPNRARLWILNRIVNPPDATPDPRSPIGQKLLRDLAT